MKTLILFLLLVVIISYNGFADNNNKDINHWIFYGETKQVSFSGIDPQTAYGFGAEIFFNQRFSLSGGMMIGENYFKITPAPLSWYALEKMSNSGYHNHSLGKGTGLFVMSLFIMDGFNYHIPLNHKLFLTPYFSPWELVFSVPQGEYYSTEKDICAFGLGIKYLATKHLVYNLGFEYDRTSLFADSGEGYSVNLSIGYYKNSSILNSKQHHLNLQKKRF